MSNEPLISIGVPVYNDQLWLPNALDHLLAQDYKNLEIILADDCSTDGSRDICKEYAQRDARIRFFENKHNLGAVGNHKLVFDVSAGDYFAWGSGHDYYLPAFVSRMFELLNSNPSVVECIPKSQYDRNGKPYVPPSLLDTRGLPPVERVKTLIKFRSAGGSMDIFYGLFRSEFLAKMDITSDAVSADEVWLAELSSLGEFMQIEEVLLHKVNTRGNTNVRANRESYRAHLDRNRLSKGTIFKEYLPRLNSFVEYLNMVERTGLSMEEKEHLHGEIKNMAAIYKKVVTEELEYFIRHFRAEIPSIKAYPLVRRIRAAQVLNALNFALLLGFEYEGMPQLRSICLSAIGLQQEARAVPRKEKKPRSRLEKLKMFFSRYRSKADNFLHKLSGRNMLQLLRRIFYGR